MTLSRLSAALSLVVLPAWSFAAVHLASPFTDHMVLQRDQPVPVWGTADAGESVRIEFAGQNKSATADASGQWRITLDPLTASTEPRDLLVSSANQKSSIENQKLSDVLVGEVWLASGQSNMDFTVAKTEKYYFAGVTDEAAEVAAANHPLIRMFTGEWAKSYEPARQVGGSWKICTPENVREFSAIGYFFARDLQKELNVPVGIVTLTFGASCAQAWIRRETIAANPKLKPVLDDFDAKVKAYTPPTAVELAEWQKQADAAKVAGKKAPKKPKPDPVQDQHNPTVMYNGMIAPFVGYAIRGVIWYQGESITAPKELFPLWNETLITDWRKLWNRELPFYFCQLAAHDNASNGPQVRAWQAEALKLPSTGMAVTIDVGDEKNVHPKNKAPVGDRLARIALANVYGRKIEFSGPVFASSTVESGAFRLTFSHLGGGLVAKDGPLKTFEIAGADLNFVSAEATIEKDTIVVRSAAVTSPAAVRYAWSNYPAGCNLTNAAGLPAAPFATIAPWNAPHVANPILPGYFADPSLLQHDGQNYLYATIDPWGGRTLGCWQSPDFKNWTYRPLNWPTKEACTSPTSGGSMVWAPSVVRAANGKFYMYVSVGSEVWVGTADQPLGPWADAHGGKPLIPGNYKPGYHMIDAEAFVDSDGSAYLYWGSGWEWKNGRCFAVKLKPDMVTFDGEPRDVTPGNYFEGPFLFKHAGRYYLSYSQGVTIADTYQVHYAIGDSPLGPFTEATNSPILVTDHSRNVVSPGHHATFSREGRDYIIYHRHSVPYVKGEAFRQTCVDELRFTAEGLIEKVDPTHTGPALVQRNESNRLQATATASSELDPFHAAARVLDDNFATRWSPAAGAGESWLQLDLGSVQSVGQVSLRFEYAGKTYRFAIESSSDGKTWNVVADHRAAGTGGSPLVFTVKNPCRFLRLVSSADPKAEPLSVWEFAAYPKP